MLPTSGAPLSDTTDPAVQSMEQLLHHFGYDQDPEAAATASRFVGLLRDFAPGAVAPPVSLCELRGRDPLVVRGLPFHSLCAHHLLPFFGAADVVHLPDGPIAGLGTFAKILAFFAKQPQLQERLGGAVADHLHAALGGTLGVRIRARHLCLEMRGERVSAELETWAVRGPQSALAMGLLR